MSTIVCLSHMNTANVAITSAASLSLSTGREYSSTLAACTDASTANSPPALRRNVTASAPKCLSGELYVMSRARSCSVESSRNPPCSSWDRARLSPGPLRETSRRTGKPSRSVGLRPSGKKPSGTPSGRRICGDRGVVRRAPRVSKGPAVGAFEADKGRHAMRCFCVSRGFLAPSPKRFWHRGAAHCGAAYTAALPSALQLYAAAASAAFARNGSKSAVPGRKAASEPKGAVVGPPKHVSASFEYLLAHDSCGGAHGHGGARGSV